MVICHLKYRKENPELAASKFKEMPLFPVMNYIVLCILYFSFLSILARQTETLSPLVYTGWFRYPLGLPLHAQYGR